MIGSALAWGEPEKGRPKFEMKGPDGIFADGIITIEGPMAKECTEFALDIWLLNATKVYAYWFLITWNSTLLNLTDYEMCRSFLEGPYTMVHIEEEHIEHDGEYLQSGYPTWWPSEEPFIFCAAEVTAGTDCLFVYVEAECWTESANGDGILFTLAFHLKDFIEQGFVWKKHQEIHVNTWINFTCWGLCCGEQCHPETWEPLCCCDIDINNVKVNVWPVPGDVNCDGKVDGIDLALISDNFGSDPLYDLNDDGVVDILDLVEAAKRIGDIDVDDDVDSMDLFTLAAAYGSGGSDLSYNPRCDFEPDGDVDSMDLFALSANYGMKNAL